MTAGFRAMMDARKGMDGCPMYATFATKLFLRVHRVLRVQHTQLFEELQATARRWVSTIDSYFRFSNNKQFTLWPAKNDAFSRQIKSIAQEWALEDRIGKFKLAVEGGLEPEPSCSSRGIQLPAAYSHSTSTYCFKKAGRLWSELGALQAIQSASTMLAVRAED